MVGTLPPSLVELWRTQSLCPPYEAKSIPGDDLAFAAIDVCVVQQRTGAPPHQEFRPAKTDRVAAPAPWRGLAGLVLQLRQREDIAPHLPGDCDLACV